MTTLSEATADQLVAAYIDLRDKRTALKADFEEEDGKLEGRMDKIAAVLLARFKEQGVESARTKFGTAYRNLKVSATMGDRDTYLGWILEAPDERIGFLDARVAKTAVMQYRNEHNDLPPGVNWREEQTINIRRS